MQFKQGAGVVTSRGHRIGRIDRVVIDPRSKAVTHVVVRKGLVFKQDKVIPVDWIDSTTEDDITLRESANDPQALPNFEEEHFVAVKEDASAPRPPAPGYVPALYWHPPFAGNGIGRLLDASRPAYMTQTHRNIPEETVALKEGARVISADGKHVGNVERVLIHPDTERVTHFIVTQGLLFKESRLIPAHWISHIGEDEVHLAVASHLLSELRAYPN